MSQDNLRGFLARVASLAQQGQALAEEFQEIRICLAAFRLENNLTTEIGGNKDNIKKNRYKDILPYDQTRVPLTLLVEEGQSDYINASFIQGLDNKRCYIATQGPLSHTVVDFWRMIWEYHVKVIVMACREVELGKKKCERYWPIEHEASSFGPFTVNMVEKKKPNAEVVLRTLKVAFQKEVREITHFQYVAWPDRGIPDSYDCFLEMIRLVRQYQGEDDVPMCVHCSAGCGRTGVICTVEYVQNVINKKKVPSDFSLFKVILQLRQQRPSAVQTKEQYEFVYHAVAEMFKKELKNSSSACYENLSLSEAQSHGNKNKDLYDDIGSMTAGIRTLPKTTPGSYSRTGTAQAGAVQASLAHRTGAAHAAAEQASLTQNRSTSVPGEPLPLPTVERTARPNKEMSDTYAVVNKGRPANPRVSSCPTPVEARCALTSPAATQYDNVKPLKNSHAHSAAPVYSAVRPKSRIVDSPTTKSPDGQKPNGSWTSPPNYSLAGASTIPDTLQENNYASLYIRGSDTEERGNLNGSRNSDIPSGWSEKVDANTVSSQATPTKGNNKLRNIFLSGFQSAPPKKASIPGSESFDSYEVVPDSSKAFPANQGLANGLGGTKSRAGSLCADSIKSFNHRIGKPKGPREPPAEWSHLER